MELLLDYPTLRVIWWLLLGILLAGFAVMDGFDLGLAALLPFAARTDEDRRLLLNAIGPVWEGNQVWLILGAGAIFAAWPPLYATAFSGFYGAMFLVLAALILRPVGFKFRSKVADPRWRTVWDWALFVGGAVPALVFGVAVGNALQGVPFTLDDRLLSHYDGGLLGLLNPFALLVGLVSLTMLMQHGAAFGASKTDGPIANRLALFGGIAGLAATVLFGLAGVWIYFGVDGYAITGTAVMDGPSNPLLKEVAVTPGAWFDNYARWPLTMLVPAVGLLGLLLASITLCTFHRPRLATFISGLGIAGVVGTVGVSMFPFILPSSINPKASLTVWDASSSHLTLFIMLVATLIFMPIVVIYTTWVYRVLSGKLSRDSIAAEENSY